MDPKSTSTVLQCSAHYKDWLDMTFYHLVSKTCLSIFLWIYDCLKLLLKHMCYTGWQESQTNIGSPLHRSASLGPFNTDNHRERRHCFILVFDFERKRKKYFTANSYLMINEARALSWRQFSYFQEWAMNKRPSAKKDRFHISRQTIAENRAHWDI